MTEGNRLIADDAGISGVSRSNKNRDRGTQSRQKENRPEDADLRDRVEAAMENLRQGGFPHSYDGTSNSRPVSRLFCRPTIMECQLTALSNDHWNGDSLNNWFARMNDYRSVTLI